MNCPTCGHKMPKPTGLAFAKPVRPKGKNVRRADCDEAEKQRRGYTNLRSVVRRDGSEVLFKEDWRARVLELWNRSDGACEMRMLGLEHAEHCSGDMHHPHHIVQRSVRRDDRLANLAGLSRACHRAVDERRVGGRSRKEGVANAK